MGPVTLRRAHADQAAELAALWRGAWHSANPQVDERQLAPPAHWLERAQREFFHDAECWAAFPAELVSGACGFVVIEPARCYLAQLHVAPAWHGRGVGRQLTAKACERMPGGWHLHVASSNRRAQDFYASVGLRRGDADMDPVTARQRIAWHFGAASQDPLASVAS